ncbi:hypothetical protein TNCV_4795001 [Trichonephila clavipes]|nr:hypothetical protein TNCV_4795001 [Trichonephila clavipes]
MGWQLFVFVLGVRRVYDYSLPRCERELSYCSLNQWVRSLVGLITSAGTGEYFPPPQFTCRNCGGGDRGRVAIYRAFGNFTELKSHCHLYGAQGQRQAYLLPMPR